MRLNTTALSAYLSYPSVLRRSDQIIVKCLCLVGNKHSSTCTSELRAQITWLVYGNTAILKAHCSPGDDQLISNYPYILSPSYSHAIFELRLQCHRYVGTSRLQLALSLNSYGKIQALAPNTRIVLKRNLSRTRD